MEVVATRLSQFVLTQLFGYLAETQSQSGAASALVFKREGRRRLFFCNTVLVSSVSNL